MIVENAKKEHAHRDEDRPKPAERLAERSLGQLRAGRSLRDQARRDQHQAGQRPHNERVDNTPGCHCAPDPAAALDLCQRWACGVEPKPASLENRPRATPKPWPAARSPASAACHRLRLKRQHNTCPTARQAGPSALMTRNNDAAQNVKNAMIRYDFFRYSGNFSARRPGR